MAGSTPIHRGTTVLRSQHYSQLPCPLPMIPKSSSMTCQGLRAQRLPQAADGELLDAAPSGLFHHRERACQRSRLDLRSAQGVLR